MAVLRTIARHGMTKGAAFFYAVAVGAAANFVMDYLHHREDVTPVVAHEAVMPSERAHTAIAPIVRPEPRIAEPRVEPRVIEPRVPEHPTSAALPPVPEVRPLPTPTVPAALPQVPRLPLPNPSAATTLPPSSDLPTPPLKPASMSSFGTPQAIAPAEDKPTFSVPPALPAAAAASAVPPLDKPVEAMSIPTPPVPSIGNPVSLLPPPDKPAEPPAPKLVKPGSGTGGLY